MSKVPFWLWHDCRFDAFKLAGDSFFVKHFFYPLGYLSSDGPRTAICGENESATLGLGWLERIRNTASCDACMRGYVTCDMYVMRGGCACMQRYEGGVCRCA